MITPKNRLAVTVALGVTALVVSCETLPDTQLKGGGASSGASASAGTGGAAASGGAGSGGVAAGAGKGGGSAGTGTAGGGTSAGGSSGSGTGGTTGGSAGSGGKGAGAGGTGNVDLSAGGASDGGAMPGGSGGSGGSSGTFSTNRDDFFGDSRCAGSTFALCEDFESGTLDTGTWTPRGAAPKIETTRAARGTHSAHFQTTDNGLQYITQTKTFPAPNNTYYARVFVWFEALPTAPAWAHWTISGAQNDDEADPEGNGPSEIRVGGQWNTNNKIELFGVGTDRGVTGDWTNLDDDPGGNPAAVPAQEWVCLEWMFDGTANETKFWWDGVEHPSLATSSTNHGGSSDPFELPAFTSMWVGWWLYQPGTTPAQFDTWIDEVAIDYERIGCNR